MNMTMDAAQFADLAPVAKADAIERISNVPITAGVWIKYDTDKDEALICLYGVALA